MNYYQSFYGLLLVCCSMTLHAEPITGSNNYWQCSIYDAANKRWVAQNTYEKIAINVAFSSCKKESSSPNTCHITENNCEQFVYGVSIKPMWVCTALDKMAQPWQSNLYSQRDDAALAAKAYCQANSAVPGTCYINLITCTNRNGLLN